MNISYSYEEKPLGMAGSLSLIQGLDSTFLVTNGDIQTTLDLRIFVAYHKAQDGIGDLAVHQRQVKIDLDVVQWNGYDHMGIFTSAVISNKQPMTIQSAWGSMRSCPKQ